MKSWLKFFGLSFFSDKIAKEARIRGILNCVLAFILALIFIYCGVLASNTVPFYSNYGKASDFKEFFYETIEKTQLTVKDKRISADGVINTFEDKKDGYNLVIDTRPSDTPDDFEAYCIFKDGKTEIPYEEYLKLSDDEKGNYQFRIRYTPNALVFTDEKIAEYESVLNACEDEDIKKQYAELSSENYASGVYALYLKAYYPDMSRYETAGKVPMLRSYYYRQYLSSSDLKKCLFVFDDVLFGYFETDGGADISFYGSYDKADDGIVTKDNADNFIKAAFSSMVSASANVYLMNVVKFIPLIAAIPLVLALLSALVLRFIVKDEKYQKYSVCLKIEFAYFTVASLMTALILFICGFFVSTAALNVLPLIIFSVVLSIRTAVYLVHEYINGKKIKEDDEDKQEK